ncbi:transcriptional regulator [Roseobacter cerasinus]|uniref:Transcriptional regulator n=1 Tax=Roseobacter cerasinus TaxID=2602289 RepID=A0A640VVI9_9RHOB|nr:helix-turn-helix domain-containing protein [Roseobacter cerasinus]GFE52428.1 transcriptional regulator [Roseobacter cerasinus]
MIGSELASQNPQDELILDQKPEKKFANTLARGLSILRAFRPSDNGLGNLEISERTGIPRSTVSRLTFTLCQERYLTHGRHHEKYHLGPAAFALGNIASASFRFVETAAPIMRQLAETTENLIGVSIYDQGEMLMVKTWRPSESPTIWIDVGYRIPVLGSSTGAAYLGSLNDDELARVTNSVEATKARAMRKLAAEAKDNMLATGYAIVADDSRYSKSINAVATPFRTTEFAEPVSFFCSGEAAKLTEAKMATEVGPALVNAVGDLQRLSG